VDTNIVTEPAVATFLARWTSMDRVDELITDPLLVATPTGTALVPRALFSAAVAARTDALPGAAPVLLDWSTRTVGQATLLVTAVWRLTVDERELDLVSDLLIQPGPAGVECVAYLPRQDPTRM
jgi:hypothetical protein